MKNVAFLFLAVLVSMPLAAQTKTLNPNVVDIGYSVPDTTNPFLGWLTGSVKTLGAAEGYNVQIADAGMSASKQMEQIENFIAMKVKVIDLMPIDPNNVQDVIKKAQKSGIKVLVAGTDTGVYDVMMNMDQYNCGQQIAEMGIDWITKTFPGTAKVKVLVIKSTGTTDMKNRSTGLIDKLKANKRLNVVVASAEASTTAGATSVMENMWQQNSDAVAVFCYNADAALGVNEYIMAQAKVNKAKFGVYSGDWSPPIQEVLDNSATNASVFRGTMQIVGPKINGAQMDLDKATFMLLKDLAEKAKPTYGKWIQDTIAKAGPAKK